MLIRKVDLPKLSQEKDSNKMLNPRARRAIIDHLLGHPGVASFVNKTTRAMRGKLARNTALHLAVSQGLVDVVERLLANGADPGLEDHTPRVLEQGRR